MNDCGYYKTAPSVFHARLERFVDDIANLVAQRADLQATIASGGDITEEVYTAGLLGRIPDCIHDDAGRNVEVVGGDVTTADELLLKGSSGFTVVVRGLPYKHCRELVADGENDPRFLVRGEAPGEAPRNYGDCLNLPALFRFGMKLPMPNTAYVYKQIKRGDLSERPKNPQACGLFQQIMTGQHGGSSCSYYKEILIMMNECDHDNNAHFDTPATAYCKAALQCQSAAIAELQRVGSSGLKKSDLDKRIRLYEEVVWGETDKAVDAVYELYLHYPGGLIDPRFVTLLNGKMSAILQRLKDQLDLPTSDDYRKQKNTKKEAFLQSIADIVWAELGVSGFQIGFDYLPEWDPSNPLDLGGLRFSGGYSWHGQSLTLNMNNMFLAGVFDGAGGTTVRDLHIETVLHEAFHHYQNELILDQSRCNMPTESTLYRQTHVFAINRFAYFGAADPKKYKEWERAYKGNPTEMTARGFANKILDAWKGK